MPAGILIVWSGFKPLRKILRVPCEVGRETIEGYDDRISRRHASITWDGKLFAVTDLKSRNGSYVGGKPLNDARIEVPAGTTVRCGRTVGVLVADAIPFERGSTQYANAVELVRAAVLATAPTLNVHASFIDWFLTRTWGNDADLAATARRIAQRCADAGDRTTLRRSDAERDAGIKVAAEFSTQFQSWLGEPPPFEIPDIVRAQRSDLIGSPDGPEVLGDATLGDIDALPSGWFQAGFETDTNGQLCISYGRKGAQSMYFRLPASSALTKLKNYIALAEALPCRNVTLVQTFAGASYRFRRGDGSTEVHVGEPGSTLADFDLMELAKVPGASSPYGRFGAFFERVMREPAPFPIPGDYVVLSTIERNNERIETMIGTGVGSTLLVQADVGDAETMPVGWFQAGFWGHGVNSYAVYYGRATERSRVYLRLRYGEGIYETDKDRARKEALATMKKYIVLADTLPCKHVTLVQSMDGAHWRIEKLDGTVIEMVHEPDELFSHLDSVDFNALVE